MWVGGQRHAPMSIFLFLLYFLSFCPFYRTCTFMSSVLMPLIALQHKHPCPRKDSNPQYQQVSCRRPSPSTARPLGSANSVMKLMLYQFQAPSAHCLCLKHASRPNVKFETLFVIQRLSNSLLSGSILRKVRANAKPLCLHKSTQKSNSA